VHDDLLAVAARRGRWWSVCSGVLLALGPAILVGVVLGIGPGLVVFAVVTAADAGWLLAGGAGAVRPPWPRDDLRPADTVVANITEALSIAAGAASSTTAAQVASPQPNVAAFDGPDGDVLVVTDGAVRSLTRDQLEAICAAQLAIAHDATCRRLEGAASAMLLVRIGGMILAVPAIVLTSIVPLAGLPFLAVASAAEAAGWITGGRLRWWARVAGDAVAVRTTRHPEPLAEGLRVLARYNGKQVGIRWIALAAGTGTTRWAVPVGIPFTSTTEINGRVVDQRTRELVEDAKLLVRAGLVRRVCLGGEPATLASWQSARDAVRAAGRAAARGGTALVEGEQVGLHGTE
jgi:Zn-dependent protease with chaperone function